MHSKINRINAIYLRIQDITHPTGKSIEALFEKSEIELQEFMKLRKKYQSEYDDAVSDLLCIFPTLSPSEVAEAYRSGSRLLQTNLSGLISHNFVDAYVPVMEEAITNGHIHSAGMFLQVLADKQGKEISSIVGTALRYRGIQHRALDIIAQLKLDEYIEEVRTLCDDTDTIVQTSAKQALEVLIGKYHSA